MLDTISGLPDTYRVVGGVAEPGGRVNATYTANDRLQVFSPKGDFLGKWGSRGTNDRQFYGPSGIAAARDGTIYVVDRGNDRVVYYR